MNYMYNLYTNFNSQLEEIEKQLILEKLLKPERFFKCCRCKNTLSVAPILVVDGTDIFCGRCQNDVYEKNSNPKIERQVAYEEMAKRSVLTLHPCQFKNAGCECMMQWGQVEKHEIECKYMNMVCLFNMNVKPEISECSWKGHVLHYFTHLDEYHPDFKGVMDKWKIWDEPKRTQVHKMTVVGQILLVILSYVGNNPYVIVIGDDEKQPVRYNVEITDETEQKSLIISQLSTFLPWNDRIMKTSGLNLNITEFKAKYLSVYFGEKRQCYNECDAVSFPQCEKCKNGIISSVYTCERGHISCKRCAEKYELCKAPFKPSAYDPLCSKSLTRNENLQKQFLRGHFVCQNRGCHFHGNFIESTFHARSCRCGKFPPRRRISKLDTFYGIDFNMKSVFDHLFFELKSSRSEDSLKFTLESSRMPREKYKFEITIVNSSLSFVMTFPIFPNFSKIVEAEPLEIDNSIEVPLELIDPEGNGKIKYKINVSKI